MIRTSSHLKELVRKSSKGNGAKAQIIMRNYAMERFLERLSLSQYRGKIVLKGGTLIAAMVGTDNRSTMDIDATLVNLDLTIEGARKIVEDIRSVQIDDAMGFEVRNIETIMDEAEYNGIRVALDGRMGKMLIPLKIDFSTGDVITPCEIEYHFKLMFENRAISVLAYNLETIIAEKLETLLTRGTANTRMRDFYDLHILTLLRLDDIDPVILRAGLINTSRRRGSVNALEDAGATIDEVQISQEMKTLWSKYQLKFDYAAGIVWDDVMGSVKKLYNIAKG